MKKAKKKKVNFANCLNNSAFGGGYLRELKSEIIADYIIADLC